MLIKRYFNMVEIMLAIVVISLGLASVFVLFPAGLNAHKNAAADNNIADLAELIISSVRTQIEIDTANGTDFSSVSWADFNDTPGDADVKVNSVNDWEVMTLLKTGTDDHDDVKNASLLRHKTQKNVFWVRQMSGPEDNRFVDFSAIGRVYVDSGSMENEFFYNFKDKTYKPYEKAGKVDIDKYLLPLVLEISYPADMPYAEREKRYFRFEVFNEHYKLVTQ